MKYTRQQIEQMPAGQGLDILIETHLFNNPAPDNFWGIFREGGERNGWAAVHSGAGVLKWRARPYSTDLDLAWKAALRCEGPVALLKLDRETCEVKAYNALGEDVEPAVQAATPALAICRAALMTCFL